MYYFRLPGCTMVKQFFLRGCAPLVYDAAWFVSVDSAVSPPFPSFDHPRDCCHPSRVLLSARARFSLQVFSPFRFLSLMGFIRWVSFPRTRRPVAHWPSFWPFWSLTLECYYWSRVVHSLDLFLGNTTWSIIAFHSCFIPCWFGCPRWHFQILASGLKLKAVYSFLRVHLIYLHWICICKVCPWSFSWQRLPRFSPLVLD